LILLLLSGLCFAADTVEGYWVSYDEKTNKPTGGWHIYAENGVLYGTLLSLYGKPQDAIATACKESYKGYPTPGKVNAQKVVGSIWIFGLKMSKPGEWAGGNVIDPQDGKMYQCKIIYRRSGEKVRGKQLSKDALEMRGEIGLGIGRSQFWEKATEAEASSLR
jgi:uncharacterized protein (DUF2147 family)